MRLALLARSARAQNRLPIFVGGTGLYFKALTRGLSAVPPIPLEIRDDVRARLERDGAEALHAELARRDPACGATSEAARPRAHRARAGSGRGDRALADRLASRWPAAVAAAGARSTRCFLTPDRDALYARIDARFDAMLAAGALDEVAALARAAARSAAAGDEGAWRAGADPASAAARSRWTEAAAIGRADTRHYAKRQFTWFRHQLPEFEWVTPEAAREWLKHGRTRMQPAAARTPPEGDAGSNTRRRPGLHRTRFAHPWQ